MNKLEWLPLSRRARAAVTLALALSLAATAIASSATTGPTVKSFSPRTGSVGTKVKFTGSDLGGVTAVVWVLYPGPKSYKAVFTKTATSVVATAPAAFPSKPGPGLIELKSGSTTITADCWGAC